jgi:hypothetical protein
MLADFVPRIVSAIFTRDPQTRPITARILQSRGVNHTSAAQRLEKCKTDTW